MSHPGPWRASRIDRAACAAMLARGTRKNAGGTMRLLAAAIIVALTSPAAAQNCPAMRKINVGVAVAPPNVVHTAPYVAKALGFFAKRCVDADIIQDRK